MVDFRLYLVTDRRRVRTAPAGNGNAVRSVPPDGELTPPFPALQAALETACRAGVRAIQLREKDLDARTLYGAALGLRTMSRRYGTKLMINDRVDVVLAADANGVHCPEQGFPVGEAARLLGRRRFVGASTHSIDAARRAEGHGANFVTFGPVFATPSKTRYGAPQGLDALGTVARSVGIPVFAIGGITPERAAACLERGAWGVALISAVLAADDPAAAVAEFQEVLGSL